MSKDRAAEEDEERREEERTYVCINVKTPCREGQTGW